MQIKELFKKCGENSGEKNSTQPTFHLQSTKKITNAYMFVL